MWIATRPPGEGQVSVVVEPRGHSLLIDGELAVVLTAADVDPLSAQTLAYDGLNCLKVVAGAGVVYV